MLNKILVGIERSAKNQCVFDAALSLAKATGASLMLLHVIHEYDESHPTLPTYSYYPMLDEQTTRIYQQQLEEYKKKGLELLRSLTEKATEAGVNSEFVQISGSPGHYICELAQTWEADLIILGTRGLTGLKEMFLGSVSNYVTHHAPCSVLLIRACTNLDPQSPRQDRAELRAS